MSFQTIIIDDLSILMYRPVFPTSERTTRICSLISPLNARMKRVLRSRFKKMHRQVLVIIFPIKVRVMYVWTTGYRVLLYVPSVLIYSANMVHAQRLG